MQNIGILLESKIDITNIDIVKNGNPGIGGSEYLLLQLFFDVCCLSRLRGAGNILMFT